WRRVGDRLVALAVALEILALALAELLDPGADPLAARLVIVARRVVCDPQRPPLGVDQMVRAGGADLGDRGGLGGGGEGGDVVLGVGDQDLGGSLSADTPASRRHA